MGFRGNWRRPLPGSRRFCKGGARRARPRCTCATPLEWPLRPLRHTLAMPFDCDHRRTLGPDVCPAACHAVDAAARSPTSGPTSRRDLPTPEPGVARRLRPRHEPRLAEHRPRRHRHGGADGGLRPGRTRSPRAGLRIRVVSCDVRRGLVVPPLPDARGGLYLGTGGPGHIDPALQRRRRRQPGHRRVAGLGVAALRALRRRARPPRRGADRHLPHLRRDEPLARRRRSGAARPREGRQERRHRRHRADAGSRPRIPGSARWRSGVADEPGHAGRIRVLDSRLYDLLPRPAMAATVTPLGFEAAARRQPPARR